MNADTTVTNELLGTSGKTALVHKQDAEGSITIDAHTGQILTPHDERPDWASDLTIAQIAMRDQFYINALGDLYTNDRQVPEVLAFEDIDWLGAREYPVDAPYINPETNAVEDSELFTIDADHDFRQQQVATVLGIEAELDEHGNETGRIVGALAEVEMASDNMRSPEEIAELEKEQATGFSKTGTHAE